VSLTTTANTGDWPPLYIPYWSVIPPDYVSVPSVWIRPDSGMWTWTERIPSRKPRQYRKNKLNQLRKKVRRA